MSVQDMRAELKLLRQEHPDFKPVSKMKKADISSLLEKMKQKLEITPAIAMTKAQVEKVAPLKAVKEVKEPKKKAEKAHEVKEEPKAEKAEKKKESMAERMARIRAMKKKE